MKSESVIGCVSCGKPALLVGDEMPRQFPACFWCLAERRPGAAELFLKEVRREERERVLNEIEGSLQSSHQIGFDADDTIENLTKTIGRLREESK